MKSVTKIHKFEKKNIPYNTALQELKAIYNKSEDQIERYLNKGIKLGNGKGVFYQILKEQK